MSNNDYRDILRQVFSERQKVNPLYSMRSFARAIGLTSSQLSRILNNKQGLSAEKANTVAEKIGLNHHEKEMFCLYVLATDARSKMEREKALTRLQKMQDENIKSSSKELQLEDYELLREWHNIAILELMDLDHFQSNPTWISRQIGVPTFLVKESLRKLSALGVIETVDNKFKKTQKILKIDKAVPSDLMKSYYDQLLTKAKDSIYLQSIHERHLSSVTVSLDEQDIEILNEEINRFRSHFNSLAEQLASKPGKQRTAVYSLTTQFFKINTGEDK